jgi:hypothetical protein
MPPLPQLSHASILLAAMSLDVLAGCSSHRPLADIRQAATARLAEIVLAIKAAPAPTLYEGLPNQMFENALLKQELATKKTLILHDFSFYQAPST